MFTTSNADAQNFFVLKSDGVRIVCVHSIEVDDTTTDVDAIHQSVKLKRALAIYVKR